MTGPPSQFGLLVALASAWSLTWYQSPGSRVWVLVFAIYCKNCCCPRLCPRVDFLFSRHTWVGVLKCISELPSPFHQFGLLVVLASAWSLTQDTPSAFFHAFRCSIACNWHINTILAPPMRWKLVQICCTKFWENLLPLPLEQYSEDQDHLWNVYSQKFM
jgi:hypothetical protein